ncbi:MAG: PAS domain S-box protein [Promethearchaeota archaeon]
MELHARELPVQVRKIDNIEILIIDGDLSSINQLKDSLERFDFNVHSFQSALSAIQHARQYYFDACLLNIKLPDMDGLDLYLKLKELRPSGIYVFMTESPSLNSVMKVLDQGADGYFVKPLEVEDILLKLKDSLEKRRLKIEKDASESKYKLILENASDIVILLDEYKNFEYVSNSVFKQLGYEKGDLINHSILDFIHPEDRERMKKFLFNSEITPELNGEFRIKKRDGDYSWFDIKGKMLTKDSSNSKFLLFSRNIDDRKENERKIAESEMRFRELVHNLSDCIIKMDRQGNILFSSPQIFDITGNYPSEVVGKNFLDLIHPDDKELFKMNLSDAFDTDKRIITEVRIKHTDGEYHHGQFTGVVVKNYTLQEDVPNYKSMNCIIRDITQRVKIEEERKRLYVQVSSMNLQLEEKIKERTQKLKETLDALEKSESQLKEILDKIPAMFYLKDINLRYLLVNEEFENVFGLSRCEIIGKNDKEIFDETISRKHFEHEMEVLKTSSALEIEEDYFKRDELHTYLTIIFPLKDAQGITYAIGSISTDITERKWAEQAIKESEIRFRTIFNSVIDGMFLIDIDSEKFYLVNRILTKMLGYSQEELLEKKLSDIIPKTFYESVQDYIRQMEKEQSFSISEVPIQGKNSQFYGDIGLSFTRLTEGYFIAGVLRDVTDMKLASEALKKAKLAAEAANRAKSNFLANMSHELRTPLNAIIGFTDLLFELYGESFDEDQKQYVNNILESATHLLTLINDILDLSKIEAGKMELTCSKFSVPVMLEKSLNMFKEKSLRHDITLQLSLEENIQEIFADETKIRQILFNLLSNAMKFTPDGGKIGVDVKKVDDSYFFTVWDTGIGIAKEDIPKLFKPFEQLEGALSRNYEGTGLGLYYSKMLVELHGGSIWVESEVGKGSKFTFSIPIRNDK